MAMESSTMVQMKRKGKDLVDSMKEDSEQDMELTTILMEDLLLVPSSMIKEKAQESCIILKALGEKEFGLMTS